MTKKKERITDLGRALDALRGECLRRLAVAEGRRQAEFQTLHDRRVPISTDDLVAKVETHADLLEECDANGWKHPSGGLGDWARPDL